MPVTYIYIYPRTSIPFHACNLYIYPRTSIPFHACNLYIYIYISPRTSIPFHVCNLYLYNSPTHISTRGLSRRSRLVGTSLPKAGGGCLHNCLVIIIVFHKDIIIYIIHVYINYIVKLSWDTLMKMIKMNELYYMIHYYYCYYYYFYYYYYCY